MICPARFSAGEQDRFDGNARHPHDLAVQPLDEAGGFREVGNLQPATGQ